MASRNVPRFLTRPQSSPSCLYSLIILIMRDDWGQVSSVLPWGRGWSVYWGGTEATPPVTMRIKPQRLLISKNRRGAFKKSTLLLPRRCLVQSSGYGETCQNLDRFRLRFFHGETGRGRNAPLITMARLKWFTVISPPTNYWNNWHSLITRITGTYPRFLLFC